MKRFNVSIALALFIALVSNSNFAAASSENCTLQYVVTAPGVFCKKVLASVQLEEFSSINPSSVIEDAHEAIVQCAMRGRQDILGYSVRNCEEYSNAESLGPVSNLFAYRISRNALSSLIRQSGAFDATHSSEFSPADSQGYVYFVLNPGTANTASIQWNVRRDYTVNGARVWPSIESELSDAQTAGVMNGPARARLSLICR